MDVIKTVLPGNKLNKEKKKGTPVKLSSLDDISRLKDDFCTLDRSKMMIKMFEKHGQFCASHPWEVIFVTLTLVVCATSMTFAGPLQEHSQSTVLYSNPKTSDVVILSITRCLAVAYIYLQFMKLRNLGSKYLLGITGILTIFFSFGFSAAVINLLGADLSGLGEAMPVFLLLVDLSKACTLAKFALSSKCQDEIVSNIGHGMALVGPMLTLDTLVEALVIGVGTLSGVRTLQVMCCFGCLSVVANYFAFMTFYPSCLAIVLELTRDNRRLVQIQQLAKVWQLDDESQKPNPVTQKVKIIMSAGLLFVHIHSRMISPNISLNSSPYMDNSLTIATDQLLTSSMPADESANLQNNFSFWQTSGFTIDYLMALVLVVVLGFKYVVFDTDYASPFIKKEVAFVDEPINYNSSNIEGKGFGKPRKSVVAGENSDKVTLKQTLIASGNENNEERTGNFSFVGENSEVDLDTVYKESTFNKQSTFFVESESSDEDDETKGHSQLVDVSTQTCDAIKADEKITIKRSTEECVEILKSDVGPSELSDDEVMQLVSSKHIPAYKLENILGDHERGVRIRRKICTKSLTNPSSLDNLPFLNFDYNLVDGACCENVIGYMPVPVGVAGPLLINGRRYMIPMATTEGCLVASTNRGCRAVSYGQGVTSRVINNGMTRAPVVKFSSCGRASDVKAWLEDKDNFDIIANSFNSTSRFARLKKLQVVQIARSLYIRFVATTGDAMGMNMLSKGCEKSLLMLQESYFDDMEILSLSGNFCTDKKPSAVNWVEGRGKSVVCEAIVSASIIRDVLKTDVTSLVHLNLHKNLVGSVAAGSIGGFNAHAANIVTAIYIATGQDPAQNVCSSNCITIMERHSDDDLYISCTMPSIEVGTVGGGTVLLPQAACLDMLGVRGSNEVDPGANAATLANIVCSAVLAGELSLMAALAAGHLVKSHLKHNRSVVNIAQPHCTTH